MKKTLLFILMMSAQTAFSDEAKNEWQNTTLSDETIEKIQAAKYEYKKCVSDEMQKPTYQQQDSRNGTEAVIKQCEPVLAKMREVYIGADVPAVVADRHLKQMRLQTTRDVLQNLMFSEAARKAGNKPQ